MRHGRRDVPRDRQDDIACMGPLAVTARFCTIGHSNRAFEEFTAILRAARVELVVDVRSFPRSRNNPSYNIDVLPGELTRYQIGYRHMPSLGGRRKRQPDVPDELNATWRNRSFHNYADYALSPEFAAALEELIALVRGRWLAMMCSEAVWWRCHRRIITDHLLLAGHGVDHLLGADRIEPAKPTPGAEPTSDGKVIYPPR
jgi:uncharacterized protein (DUF488 family)